MHVSNVRECVVGDASGCIRFRVNGVADSTELCKLLSQVPIKWSLLGHCPHHVVEERHATKGIKRGGVVVRHALQVMWASALAGGALRGFCKEGEK